MSAVRLTSDLLLSVAALEQAVFAHPWSARALELLCGDTAFGFACTAKGGEVIAYGGMLTVLDEGQITNVATHPDHRRQGLAGQVLAALLGEARARGLSFVTLEVRVSNVPAIALYQKFGFAIVGRRPRFYAHPTEDALIMRCDLIQTV
ncbi:MAG: ribosomal protein S18-alanine N-acetyltransferase [Clostridia bacterium]|nr:ribosomal protein S18-alanine N-acetyltransferase [Clostridia bacterium]